MVGNNTFYKGIDLWDSELLRSNSEMKFWGNPDLVLYLLPFMGVDTILASLHAPVDKRLAAQEVHLEAVAGENEDDPGEVAGLQVLGGVLRHHARHGQGGGGTELSP